MGEFSPTGEETGVDQNEQNEGDPGLRRGQIVKYPTHEQMCYCKLSYDTKDGSPIISPTEINFNEPGRVAYLGPSKVDQESLEHFNPPVSEDDISTADNAGELFRIVSRLPGLQGSQGRYSSGQLIEALTRYFKDEVPETVITRTAGLRDKAVELKQVWEQQQTKH